MSPGVLESMFATKAKRNPIAATINAAMWNARCTYKKIRG